MAKPKLALIPAAQGSKLFSVLPSSGVGDFNFSRSGKATRINSEGLIETVGNGQSRLNYPMIDGKVVGCPHHILEPQKTNLFEYSEDFSQSVWTTLASGETIVSNSVISPDGTLNADTLKGDGTATNVFIRQDVVLNTSTDYTFSIFAKKGTNDFLAISAEYYSGSTNTLVIFDLNNGLVTTGTANIEDYGNGWFRCSYTTAISTDGTGRYLIYPAFNGTTRGFPTSSDANGQNIYLWGAMLEQGSYATSYIPTNGSSVTRQAETANGSGDASTFNDSEGVLMAEIKSENTSVGWIGLGSNSANRILLGGNGTYIRSYNNIGGTIIDYTSSIIVSDNNKIAIKYKSGDTDIYINGFKLFESNSAFSVSSPFDEIQFKNLVGETQNFYGKTKQIQYFDSALDSQQLEQLTSWTSFSDMANGQLYTIQ